MVLFCHNETEGELQYIRNPRLIKLQTGSHGAFAAALRPEAMQTLSPGLAGAAAGPGAAQIRPGCRGRGLAPPVPPAGAPPVSPRSPDTSAPLSGLHRPL